MKVTMNHPEANYLAALKLPSNDLEKVAGGEFGFPFPDPHIVVRREYIVYGLTWATLTLYGYEYMPDNFEEYFSHMISNEESVLVIMYNSFVKGDLHVPIDAKYVTDNYKIKGKSEKRDILMEVYHKFK